MHPAPRSARTVPRPLIPLLLLLAFGSLGGLLFLLPGRGGLVHAASDSSHHEVRLAAQATQEPTRTSTWDGGSTTDSNWTTPANWEDDLAPEPGSDLVFPAGAAQLTTTNDFPVGTPFTSITIAASGYVLNFAGIGVGGVSLGDGGLRATYASGFATVNLASIQPESGGTIQAQQPDAELRINSNILLGDAPITFAGAGTVRVNAPIVSPTFGVTKTGSGLLVLTNSANTYSGPTVVNAGTLQVDGRISQSAVTVQAGTLSGGGNIDQSLTLTEGAVSPGNAPGTTNVLTTGPATLAGGTYRVEVGSGSSGSRSDQLAVTGSVTLGGAGLVVQPVPSNPPSAGQEFIIVDNDGADAVSGTFAGLAEGATIPVGGIDLRISYVGGDGNDVTLAVAAPEPPAITSITPNYGPADGQDVTIEGGGFSTTAGATRFAFANGTDAFVNVQCSTTDTCTATSIAQPIPRGNLDGAQIFAEVGGQRSEAGPNFWWYGRPVLDSLTPASGSPMGGNTVTLSGNTFPRFPNAGVSPAGPVTVRFGTATATGVSCTSGNPPSEPSTCTVTAPAGTPDSTVNVTIETPGGVSNPLPYTYTRRRPVVTGVNPTRGRQAGNDRVTIRGTNLAPPSSAAAGPGGPGGSGPGAGPGDDDADAGIGDGVIGGGPIPVDPGPGAEPGAGTLVQFGTAVATNVSCNADGTQCTATSPAGPPGGGTVNVRVTVNSQQSEDTPADDFTYVAAPVATDDSATTPFGTSITIDVLANDSGDGIRVTAITQPANGSATINSDGAISYTPRTGFSGTDTFTYTITDAVSQTASAGVTVAVGFPAPTIAAVTPPSGPAAGGTPVTITGSGFQPGATVSFGGVAATVTSITSTTIMATTPPHAPGPVDVTVTNTDNQAATLTNGFSYVGAPVISGITPAEGPTEGGTRVSIQGSGFQPGATVRFDGLPATNVVFVSATEIQATTPPHTVGPVAVSVHNPDGQGASLPGGFTYIELTPTLTSISPSQGPEVGGTPVSITGTGFRPGETSVSFGGVPASGVDCPSPTQCQAVSPPGRGTVSVRVTVAGRTSPETAAAGFTYEPPPRPMTLGVQVWRQLPPLVGENQTEPTIVPVVGGAVEALVGGVVCGQGVTDSQGRASLLVAADPPARGCGRDGASVSFRVNGAAAASDPLTFRSGGQAAVTLILPGPMPPPRR